MLENKNILDSDEIPTKPEPPEEHRSSVSALDVPTGTSSPENGASVSHLDESANGEVTPKSSRHTRNGAIFDRWSIVHFATGTLFGWLMAPIAAFIIMTTWEPLEIFVISPIVARFNIVFGYETIRNSMWCPAQSTTALAVGE